MALFYSEKMAKKPQKKTACPVVEIQSLDYQGLGVTKVDGKTWFVEHALPTEKVAIQVIEEKRQYGRAKAVKWLKTAENRQTPSCAIYSQCGGCQMQHISLEVQRETKQQALFQRLQKLQSSPIALEPMLVGQAKGYRRRTKLSIALQNGNVVMGFRMQNSNQIIPLEQCEILTPALSALLLPLQNLLLNWKQKKHLGHIELVEADNTVAMLLRYMGELAQSDLAQLLAFAKETKLSLFLMNDAQQIEHICGEKPYYKLNDLTLHFSIRDFIQVNAEQNQKMVVQALKWLALEKSDRVLDLFCGMGNFTLPLAQQAGYVVGVEGVEEMVVTARQNAVENQLDNVAFYQTNLDERFVDQPWATEAFNKVLLDPARHGAYFALDHLCELNPERIVYVSCNPATLVRDAEKLIKSGYSLAKVAVIDMFPHTGHLESISLFVKAK
ncbi:MAG: 23S rRNA (uracil(1939)-C(5))-methyltransferase RlmD [Actinobacillus minor]|nr:23S rRNA (uracil(1939)-C(5))-methyltransferase RlmD [Actinobacillus minor]